MLRQSATRTIRRQAASCSRSNFSRSLATSSLVAPKSLFQSPSRIFTPTQYHRKIFSFLKRKPIVDESKNPAPLLEPGNLFHPLSTSPVPNLRQKAERIKSLSLCPVSLEKYGEHIHPSYDCPNCGFPTHATRERWEEGKAEHDEVCARLREVNEDEHDLRSGRKMTEFENLPGPQPYESSVSFQSWDTLFFTRNFVSIDSDRAIRHISKLLTYPMTIAGVLHQNGPYTAGNGRITREGRRSMAAVHSILHLPPGSTSSTPTLTPQPPFRLFLLGARAESTLPPAMWEQLSHLFPRTTFHIYFIGPEVGIPLLERNSLLRRRTLKANDGFGDHTPNQPPTSSSSSLTNENGTSTSSRGAIEFTENGGWGVPSCTINVSYQLSLTSLKAPYQDVHSQLGPFDPYTDVFFAFSPGLGFPSQPNLESTPSASTEGATTLDRAEEVTGTEAGSTAAGAADSYSPEDVEETATISSTGSQPTVQAQTTWKRPLQQILRTKCALFFTAFSPTDLARDVSALSGTPPPSLLSINPSSTDTESSAGIPSLGGAVSEYPSNVSLPTAPPLPIEGVTDEYELVLTPGKNWFSSGKWEIAEWDSRVGVRTNWAVWGIRGKKYEVVREDDEE